MAFVVEYGIELVMVMCWRRFLTVNCVNCFGFGCILTINFNSFNCSLKDHESTVSFS